MSQKLPTVQFVDALVGARKTSRTIDFIASSPASDKFLIATPNTTLSKETAAKLEKAGVSVLQIDSENGTNCQQALIAATGTGEHKVIIANLDVILKLNRMYMADYHLFIDEIPNIYESFYVEGMVLSKKDVRNYFTVSPTKENAAFLDLCISNEGVEFLSKWRAERLVSFAPQKDKRGNDKPSLPKILETLMCEHYRMVIDTEAHNKFIDSDGIRLTFCTLMQPSVFLGFKSVTILGANFRDSFLYMVHEQNIRFVPHGIIKGFYDDHSHKAKQTKIFYFSHRNCSKTLLMTRKLGFRHSSIKPPR
ncbi:hypothetical protein [Rhizobium sp. Root483D2]|uniref:hypothetical protein n=1 Tax=Rhizobium sp. Root483D2 TaxID=1736545 RepID=UPI000715FF59|nr:hypothetical protein [Rhizobium sp. Root483D2]KQY31839.1 hypothetical protein ASD32_04425 [Rhizobium sp. Root483D2]